MFRSILVSSFISAAAAPFLAQAAPRDAPPGAVLTLAASPQQCVRPVSGTGPDYKLVNSCNQCVRVTVLLGAGDSAVESMHTIEARSVATVTPAPRAQAGAATPRLVAETQCDSPV
jgi:hypothetical protein